MSFDLYLIDLPPGADVFEVLESFEEAPPSRELVDRIRKIVSDVADEGYVYNEPGTQIFNESIGATIDIAADSAVLNAAYWHRGAAAERAMASVIGLVGQIRDATGWTLYDPQSDEVVADLSALLGGASSEMDRIAGFIDKVIADKRPWWKFWG